MAVFNPTSEAPGSKTVPDLVIPAYGLLWGAHEVTLVVRKDSSLFEATTAFSSK